MRLLILQCLTLPGLGLAHRAFSQAPSPCGGLSSAATPPAKTVLFPISEVKRGLCGVAYTVFEGVVPEPMQVEILGLMKNARGPGQDMILARLHGIKPEYTGVVAGMSGSPVYIDGKLLGALSFRIGQFSKEPIGGITPIGEMLAVRDGETTSLLTSTPPSGNAAEASIQPIETPLIFGGFSQDAIERFGDTFRAMGLTPVAGLGGSDPSATQPEPLIPGSAVSAILVRGDLSMAGTCTVTYVDVTHLLACGHPITQFGHIAFPMTKATVLATLPSPLNAFKIITTTETVGEFTEDRNAAILGRFGQSARMIPATIEIVGDSGADGNPGPHKIMHFEVVDNRDLTPSVMLVSVFQSLQQTNLASAEASYRLTGELTVAGEPSVKLSGIMAPNELNAAAINTALYINDRFGRLYSNTSMQPTITGLSMSLTSIGAGKTATLEGVRLSKMEVHAGETLEVEATLHPLRLPPQTVRIPVTVPTGTAMGDLRLVVGDGPTVDRMSLPTGAGSQGHSVSVHDTIAQMNRGHDNNRLYVTLLVHNAQTTLDGGTWGAVPLSMANIFDSTKADQKIQTTGESAVELGSTGTGFALTGSQVLSIKVR